VHISRRHLIGGGLALGTLRTDGAAAVAGASISISGPPVDGVVDARTWGRLVA
jgi:hypothetical protein